MAIDRQGTGLAVVRVSLGAFFIAAGLSKYEWFMDSSILAGRLAGWLAVAASGSSVRSYLEHFAIPGTVYLARLVPIGEFGCGVALLLGLRTPFAAFVAFLLALNFDFASGQLLRLDFFLNGYGLPVLGPTLGLAIGGVRLPWSIRS